MPRRVTLREYANGEQPQPQPRRRTVVAETPPLAEPAEPVLADAWSLSRTSAGKIAVVLKTANGHPSLLYLTAREAVRFASHLLANAEGMMQEEELRRPRSGTV